MSNTVFSVYSHRELQHHTQRFPPPELTGSTIKKVRVSSPDTLGNWNNLIAKTEAFSPQVQRLEKSRRFAENYASLRTINAEYNLDRPEPSHIKIFQRDASPGNPGRLENLYARGDDKKDGWKPNTRRHYSPDHFMSQRIDLKTASPRVHPIKLKQQEGELRTLLQPTSSATDLIKENQSQKKKYLLQSSITTLPANPCTLKLDARTLQESRSTSEKSKLCTIRGTYTSDELRQIYGIRDRKPNKRDPNASHPMSINEALQINPRSPGLKRLANASDFQISLRVYDKEWKSPEKRHVDLDRSMHRSTLQLC